MYLYFQQFEILLLTIDRRVTKQCEDTTREHQQRELDERKRIARLEDEIRREMKNYDQVFCVTRSRSV